MLLRAVAVLLVLVQGAIAVEVGENSLSTSAAQLLVADEARSGLGRRRRRRRTPFVCNQQCRQSKYVTKLRARAAQVDSLTKSLDETKQKLSRKTDAYNLKLTSHQKERDEELKTLTKLAEDWKKSDRCAEEAVESKGGLSTHY
jgi:hypothetical protein